MKKFILRILFFFFVLFLFFILGLILPATPQATKSILFSKIAKDSLLKNVPSPRIIFIGGSNLNMGLNSQLIKDSLGLNPINTSITVNIGLIYMMDDMLKYIKKGDVVIAAPEYAQYYNKDAYGGEPLLRIIFDVPHLV